MKKVIFLIGLLFFNFVSVIHADNKEIPFTLQDRDRIIQTEQKVDLLKSEMNAHFESFDKRFDQLFNFLWAIIGIFTSMFVAMLGFAFWDRKLSVSPLRRDNERLVKALQDYARHQPKLSEALRNAGLL